ncbi:3-isopropylmalate dehydratase small subunit [Candidatus Methylospira mobilis]|uniref:3-isopropylmalate dehydratase small subunit n=1 Tax=Candidatus Methylospira mobilis TaxID=1808979 RepID=A0A5Q0BM60_9GAMM|nr:3-isopropylmalate dehydratase small subunit [Candidatus Methylospira mobilis]QFY43321.1 3-isopropylmalate dehydratase small subunit [Candidatus Methylospira mobilis]WNV03471.1 3-isopropylmalate dehydratase small subunit [Candidatus Methylospira mobilis]
MQPFRKINSRVVPLDRPNVDTDAIIPKQFLKSIKRSGFGPYLFDEWRYLDRGEPGMDCTRRPLNPEFILNKPVYFTSRILLARENFGCGSSREHAPWALEDYGFKVIIAPSFGDIFYNNCFKNGLLPIILSNAEIDSLFKQCSVSFTLTVDLSEQIITTSYGEEIPFIIDPSRKHRLLKGLDDIGLTLKHANAIRAYEAKRAVEAPWLFPAQSHA